MTTDNEVPTFAPNFRRRLWEELAQVHDQRNRTNGPSDPDEPDAAEPAGIRERRGRLGRRSMLVGAGSIAAAALLVAGLVATQGDDGDRRGGDSTSPNTSLVADVLAKTEAAAANSVVHVVSEVSEDGRRDVSESWTDQTTGSTHSTEVRDGVVWSEVGHPVSPPTAGEESRVRRFVNHCDRTYADETIPRSDDPDIDAVIDEHLRAGQMVEDGTEVVDGRELLRLEYNGDLRAGPEDVVDDYLLVDPTTHLPVRAVLDTPDQSSVTTFEYLPRTPENLALAAAPSVPEGYVRVDPSDVIGDLPDVPTDECAITGR